MSIRTFLLLTTVLALLSVPGVAQQAPVKVIFDSDMALDPEDMNALSLLHALADKGEAEILATIASGYETNRASGATRINQIFHKHAIPVARSPWTPAVRDGFPHDTQNDDRVTDAVGVYRKVLSEQPDNSVVIVTTGWLVNLQDLLEFEPDGFSDLTGSDLVAKKVKELSAMGGHFPNGWEYNFSFAGVGYCTKYIMDHWPVNVPITISGFEIGEKIISGKVYQDDLPDSPLRIGLENAWNALSEGRPSWDETSVLYAVRGLSHNGEEYWTKQSNGHVDVEGPTGITSWKSTPDKNHAYLVETMDPEKIGDLFEALVIESTKNAIARNKGE